MNKAGLLHFVTRMIIINECLH